MKKKFINMAAILTMAMGLVAGCGSQTTSGGGGSSSDAIKIGVDLELTGGQASFGTSALKGVQLAVDEINQAGGINGKRIDIVQADNASKPEESTRVVKKLISQDKVVAIIGPTTSTNTLAAVQAVQDKEIPFITSSATNPKVTVNDQTGKVNDFVFRACFIDPFQGSVMANFAAQNLHAKTAVIYTDTSSDYSKGLTRFFEQTFTKNGGKILSKESYQQGDTDFNSVLTRIKGEKPDVIYVPGYYQEVGKIVKQARAMGITVPMLGGDGWDAPQLVDIAGKDALNNTYISNHYAADDPDPTIQKFVSTFKNKYNSAPDAFAVLSYDATKMLADAIKRAGSVDPVKIRDALAATKDFKAVTGTITLDQNHDPIKAAAILAYKDGKQVFQTKINPQ